MDLSKMLIMTPDELRINPNFTIRTESEAREIVNLVRENDPRALFLMGNQFDAKRNYEAAAKFYFDAANLGYAPAEHYLALCLMNGDGVEPDKEMAKYWMAEAANDGDATAALWLGTRYDRLADNSHNVPFDKQDDELSSYWYLFAAKMGNKQACYNIAYNYSHGIGIQVDGLSAAFFYNKAAILGYQLAINFLKECSDIKWDKDFFKIVEKSIYNHKEIKFGKYFISSRTKKEPIPWIVVRVNDDDNSVLCVSKYSLLTMPFCERNGSNTWANSKIRKFLNNEFIEEAFDASERQSLIACQLHNSPNPVYMTKSGESVDLVTIPDVWFVTNYLNKNETICEGVDASTFIRFNNSNVKSWWLRNTGKRGGEHDFGGYTMNDYLCCTVTEEGKINYTGSGVSTTSCGVRPVILIKK